MRLYRIHLNPRSREARRDLADPYQMHATLCRAFFPRNTPCPAGALLWRLEPETDQEGRPRVLIQSHKEPDWSRIPVHNWLACADPGINLAQRLALDTLESGRMFRFRLRANPCKTVNGKRQGLFQPDAQRGWLARKGTQHGFTLPGIDAANDFVFDQCSAGEAFLTVRISQEQMLRGRQHNGNAIHVYSVLFEGFMTVTNPEHFRAALENGIGHGKVMGLGLLSIAPLKL
jgi:CRISPR system Cascade subunit CasE